MITYCFNFKYQTSLTIHYNFEGDLQNLVEFIFSTAEKYNDSKYIVLPVAVDQYIVFKESLNLQNSHS